MKSLAQRMVCFLLVAALAPGVWATTAIKLTTEEMVEQAEVISIGKYVDSRSQWVDGTLVTLVTVSVSESLKGESAGTLTVALPGGADANRRFPVSVTWPGAPTIAPNEEVLLFLNMDQTVAGGLTVVGFAQGKFSVVSDAAGQKYVSRDLRALNLLSSTGNARGKATLVPLEEFKAEVKRICNKGKE